MTFDDWYNDWIADPGNDCPGRSDRDDMREAFQAGYDAATDYYARGGSFK